MDRRTLLYAIGAAAAANLPGPSMAQESPEHTVWVGHVLQRMLTIKPGMTRGQLLKVFKSEGGLSTPLRRSYVSQDCPYFKVHVTLAAVGRPSKDADGRMTSIEDNRDIIKTISDPYLQFIIMD